MDWIEAKIALQKQEKITQETKIITVPVIKIQIRKYILL
jgi:hypothetical protein